MNSNTVLFERKVERVEEIPRTDMRLLLQEWGFHIFSSSLCSMMMGATFFTAICICADLALNSALFLQILKAVFDNPIAFAVVWVVIYLAILACTAIRTIEEQKPNYRVYKTVRRCTKR